MLIAKAFNYLFKSGNGYETNRGILKLWLRINKYFPAFGGNLFVEIKGRGTVLSDFVKISSIFAEEIANWNNLNKLGAISLFVVV